MSWPPWPPVMQPRGAFDRIVKVTMPGTGMISKIGDTVEEVNPTRNLNRALGKDAVVSGGGKSWQKSQENSTNNIAKEVPGLPDNLYA